MKKSVTERGFAIVQFNDQYGTKCSLQKSSLATEDSVWLGVDDPEPKILASKMIQNGIGWMPFPIPDGVHLTTRMHLNRDQAREIAEALLVFANTGELYEVVGETLDTDEPNRSICEAVRPIIGDDQCEIASLDKQGSHYTIVLHDNANDLEEGETEVAVWITDQIGNREGAEILTCHVADYHEYDRWVLAADEGRLISYLKENWGNDL